MSTLRVTLLSAPLLLWLSAQAAPALEGLRLQSRAERNEVSRLRSREAALRQELEQVSARILELKASRGRRLLPNDELQASLRHSQQLSGQMTQVAKDLSIAEAESQRSDLALVSALTEEMARLRSEYERAADRGVRSQLLSGMHRLRTEREELRTAFPASSIPQLESPRPSEDPVDLLEQADAARDSEDKVRQQLRGVESRMAELRQERDLDRRMNEFLRDQRLFDEQDRQLRGASGEPPSSSVNNPSRPIGTLAVPPGSTRVQAPPIQPHPEDNSSNGPATSNSGAGVAPGVTALGSDAVHNVTKPFPQGLGAVPPADSESLESLEARRQRLKSLADQLENQARQLETRAHSLK